jgi:hypothetical protein
MPAAFTFLVFRFSGVTDAFVVKRRLKAEL